MTIDPNIINPTLSPGAGLMSPEEAHRAFYDVPPMSAEERSHAVQGYRKWLKDQLRTETVRWIAVTDRMPDDDTTVLVTLEGQGEPTWLGWWDGLGWCDVCTGEYFTGQVIAWAPTLKGMQR